MTELKGYKVNKLEVENKARPGSQLKLQTQVVTYNMKYMEGENKCVGLLEFRVSDAGQNPFEVRLEAVAEFTYEEGDEKADIHVNSFDQLFPFIRQTINTAVSLTGMPGLLIPIVRLNRDTVRVAGADNTPQSSPLN